MSVMLVVPAAARNEALARAALWQEPAVPIEEADLGAEPAGGWSGGEAACTFKPRLIRGSTPKFYCEFDSGEVLKVKYGTDAERRTEVAATRLMAALGAGADRVYRLRRLHCRGCPSDPVGLLRCLSSPFAAARRQCAPRFGLVERDGKVVTQVDAAQSRDFDDVTVERTAGG
jgi:hypothetical protein